jgi:hypothetical protein
VDAISPWRDAGSIHVFHILQDEVAKVAELLRYELTRLGELESFLSSTQARKLISGDEAGRLEQRIQAARLIIDDWRARHDRPVDNRALADSTAVSDHFMDRVRGLNEKLGGDPKALVEGLRDGQVSRFRSDNIDQLETWLIDQGYCNGQLDPSSMGSAAISLQTGLPPEEVTRLRDWIVAAINNPLGSR